VLRSGAGVYDYAYYVTKEKLSALCASFVRLH
jgi:hypothetical protein